MGTLSRVSLRFAGKLRHGLVIAYVLVLGLPCLAGIFAYASAFRAVRSSIEDTNTAILDHTSEIIDQGILSVEQMTNALAWNPLVTRFLSVSDPLEKDNYALMRQVWRGLPRYQVANNLVADYYVYFWRSDVIMSPDLVSFRLPLFYGSTLAHVGLSFEEWYRLLMRGTHNREILAHVQVTLNGKPLRTVAYFQSLPLGTASAPAATVVFYLREEAIARLLARLKLGATGWAAALDGAGRTIVTAGDPPANAASLIRTLSERQRQEMCIGSEMYSVAFTRSGQSDWSYLVGVPKKYLMARLSGVKSVAAASVFIAVAIGTVLAYSVVYRASRPLRDAIAGLSAAVAQGADRADPGLTVDDLGRSISGLVERDRRLLAVRTVELPLVRAALLDRLLIGDVGTEKELHHLTGQARLVFAGRLHVCVVIRVMGFGSLISGETLTELTTCRILVRQTAGEIAGSAVHCVDTAFDSVTLLVSSPSADRSEFEDTLNRWCEQLASSLKGRFGVRVECFRGGMTQSLLEVCRSFFEAQRQLEAEPTRGSGPRSTSVSAERREENYYYPIHVENALITALRCGDRERWRQRRHVPESLSTLPRHRSQDIQRRLPGRARERQASRHVRGAYLGLLVLRLPLPKVSAANDRRLICASMPKGSASTPWRDNSMDDLARTHQASRCAGTT